MHPDEFLFFVFAMSALGAVTKVVLKLIDRRRSDTLGSGTASAELATMREQLSRLEHSVDAIAVELERVGEGQRFTTRLLSERAAQELRAVSPPRQTTPH